MADDKKGADDLFEDLDKFFAPIKDVDWPDPAEPETKAASAATSTRPEEEHVKVHVSDPAARAPQTPKAEPAPPPAPPPISEEAAQTPSSSDDEDAAWYDTDTLAADDIQMTPEQEEGSAEGPSTWRDIEDISSVRVEGPPPSEEEVEAAAEHFAESIRSEEDEDPSPEIASPGPDDTQAYDREELLRAPEDEDADEIDEEDVDQILSGAGPRTVKIAAEGFGGPSWQEPTSVEVGADVERHRGDKDGLAPWITGGALLVITFVSLAIGAAAFAFVATVMILLAQIELYSTMIKRHYRPATLIGLVAGAFMSVAAYLKGEPGLLGMFAVGVVASFLWFLALPQSHRRNAVQDVALTVLGIALIPLLGGYLLVMLKAGGTEGVHLVSLVIGLVIVSDVVAFAVGSVWGGSWIRRPLAQATSPKKSWEGFIVAAIVTFIVAVAAGSYYGPLSGHKLDAALVGIVVCVAALFGDLAESLIKRDLAVKDMGSILPGHGGVLDRVDSLLFAAPAAFLLLRVIFG